MVAQQSQETKDNNDNDVSATRMLYTITYVILIMKHININK